MPEVKKVSQETKGIPPKKEKALSAYTNMAFNMIHGKQSHEQVKKMLQAGDPAMSIPNTALTIHQFLEQNISKNQGKVQKDVAIASTTPIVSDLIDIGEGAGFFKLEPEQAQAILKDSVQQYIEVGLKSGSIDPVKLQGQVAPLLDRENAQAGLQGMQQERLSPAPTRQMMNKRIAKNAVMEDRQRQPQQGVLG